MARVHCRLCHSYIDSGAAQGFAETQAKLILEPRALPIGQINFSTAVQSATFQQVAKHGLMHAKLLTDRRSSQANLPANMPLTRSQGFIQQAKLHTAGLIQRQPIKPLWRVKNAFFTHGPKIVDNRLTIHDYLTKQNAIGRLLREYSAR